MVARKGVVKREEEKQGGWGRGRESARKRLERGGEEGGKRARARDEVSGDAGEWDSPQRCIDIRRTNRR